MAYAFRYNWFLRFSDLDILAKGDCLRSPRFDFCINDDLRYEFYAEFSSNNPYCAAGKCSVGLCYFRGPKNVLENIYFCVEMMDPKKEYTVHSVSGYIENFEANFYSGWTDFECADVTRLREKYDFPDEKIEELLFRFTLILPENLFKIYVRCADETESEISREKIEKEDEEEEEENNHLFTKLRSIVDEVISSGHKDKCWLV